MDKNYFDTLYLKSDLPPDLRTGTTLSFLIQEGNFPLNTDSIKSLANISDVKSATNLNARGGI